MCDVAADVGLERDVHRPGEVHRALEGQVDVGGDLGAGAVRADQVLRADAVLVAGEPVQHLDGDSIGVLAVGEVLGGEPGLRTALRRVTDQDRLEIGLRDVHGQAWRGQTVVRLPVRARAPGVDTADLLTRDAGAEHGVADERVVRGVGQYLPFDAHIAENLHRAFGW
ncbi:hypothetical protein [Streptomyces bobili]